MGHALTSKSRLLLWLLVGCSLPAAVASAADQCLETVRAEQARVEREFTARPPGPSREAQIQWSRELHAALEEIEKRARQCEEDRRPKPGSPEFERDGDALRQCLAGIDQKLADLDARYKGSSLDKAEQAARREAESRLLDERMACQRAVRR
jgi:hypothetical protein